MEVVEKALHVYDDYLWILKENQRITNFISQDATKFRREEFSTEIQRLESTIFKIKTTMPTELRMNMFLVDMSDLSSGLCKKCEDLIDMILKRALDYVVSDVS